MYNGTAVCTLSIVGGGLSFKLIFSSHLISDLLLRRHFDGIQSAKAAV